MAALARSRCHTRSMGCSWHAMAFAISVVALGACSGEAEHRVASSAFCEALPQDLSGALSGSAAQDPATVERTLDDLVDAWDRLTKVAPVEVAPVVGRLDAYTRQARDVLAATGFDLGAASGEDTEAERQLGEAARGAVDDERTFQRYVNDHCPRVTIPTTVRPTPAVVSSAGQMIRPPSR
jgi:hypothetical protein